MTTDQQDQILLGYLRSYFAATTDPIMVGTIAARTAISHTGVQDSLARLYRVGAVDVAIGQVLAVR
jgi:hypothetical protein